MKISRQAIIAEIDKLSRTKKILIQVLILAAICGAAWYFYLAPVRDNISRMQQEVESLQQDINIFSAQAAKFPKMEEEVAARERELLLAQTLLPEDAHALERLLASFERIGDERGVTFLMFQPGSEEVKEHFAARNVQLRLQGYFHNLMSYFDELSRLDRLVSLQSLRLSPLTGVRDRDRAVLSAEAVLLVYRSLSKAELERD
ncbi:type 4a pilus biogenesis protein PilO [Desulfonatronovibrio magnus]|uniref:type 4a pilus biogenesis protein PilO n=1 Tax=Desulfonatronovibrio magnus TaxID=698827 RepID=UPI0005EB7DAA|nr:type 4a pilus biogenesis protein PilO [Desulfonatronovibrio magnus]